jgi:simple sugar transport system permease protein
MTETDGGVAANLLRRRRALGGLGFVLLFGVVILLVTPGDVVNQLDDIVLNVTFLTATLQAAVPIAMAGIGGLYAEKSGVINIGLEGLLILSAFTSVAVTFFLTGSVGEQTAVWIGFFAAVAISALFSLIFAAICIDYKADQIIAGLAIWLLALGVAPFTSKVIFGQVNSSGVPIFNRIAIPVLADVPVIGEVLFNAFPTTYMMLITVPVAAYVLNRTPYGTWVKASGERPEALDTAGVNVRLVRYSSVLVSGVLSGIGGAALTLSSAGRFIGTGATMVDGRGFIGIVTYLMGNYNPIWTFASANLFAGMDAFQVRLQQIGVDVPAALIGIIPHLSVIAVLVFFGYTRIPDRVGEHYESGEE